MDQIKIGKFIGEQRKMHNLTQSKLSEKLGITDRAISKWERGNSLPDIENIFAVTVKAALEGAGDIKAEKFLYNTTHCDY